MMVKPDFWKAPVIAFMVKRTLPKNKRINKGLQRSRDYCCVLLTLSHYWRGFETRNLEENDVFVEVEEVLQPPFTK